MGYTKFTTELIERHIKGVKSVLDLGSQNYYVDASDTPPFVSEWYNKKGIEHYVSVDLAGDNGALKMDLAEPIYLNIVFDLVVDAGTSEHVVKMKDYKSVPFHDGHINSVYPVGEVDSMEGFYNCWINKYNFCNTGGKIISENPKTGNWPSHGYSYIDQNFYMQLCNLTGMEILELGEHAASSNFVDGWEIYAVLKKTRDRFIPFEDFQSLSIFQK